MDEKRTFLVTGATGAIGGGIAKLLAEDHDNMVVILARNKGKAIEAVERIKFATSNKNVAYKLTDLSRQEEIKELAASWEGPLDVLITNAGATPRRRVQTPEGIEMQWATNVLGYFWMIKYFSPILAKSKAPRIVNVASYWAGDMDMADLEFKNRHYNNDTAYRQSKQADRMLTVAFAERLKSSGITVNACHPGDVRSTLAGNLGYGGHETPEQGAATPVWLATAADVKNSTGKYFEHRRESTCRFGQDRDHVEKLYQICDAY